MDLAAWCLTFLADAHQLDQPQHGAEWYRRSVDPAEAARWANLGFTPAEAAPHIAAGLTAATYDEMERHAEEQAGGVDELAAQRVRQWLDNGELKIGVQDPFDPSRTILP